MKILNFKYEHRDQPRLGVIAGGKVLDVKTFFEDAYESVAPDWFMDSDHLIGGGEEAMDLLGRVLEKSEKSGEDHFVDEASVIYSPSLLHPTKMLMVGVNYASHAPEPGVKPPDEPYVFVKLSNALLGHKGTVMVPHYTRQPDNEIELGVVIGKRCRDVSAENAMDCVAGFTVMNDFSFRDLRNHPSPIHRVNFLRAKNLDNAAPMGPYVVTKDEVPDPYNLNIVVEINGKEQQSATTTNMNHRIPALIEYISRGITLNPGDLISSGTPLQNATKTGNYLKDGDVVRATIDRVGTLETKVKFL